MNMTRISGELLIRQSDLDSAVAAGVLPQQTALALAEFMREGAAGTVSEDEQIRLVTGFGDIFVTLGIILFLGALSYILADWTTLAIAPVAWGLAELFTRQRRMALPSIVLLVAFVLALFFGTADALGQGASLLRSNSWVQAPAAVVGLAGAVLHWWSFRVPITIAAGFASFAALVAALIFGRFPGLPAAFVFLPLGITAFLLAMRFDMQDPLRQSRRADMAFWLHVLAAPMIVHSIMPWLADTSSMTTAGATAVLSVFFVLAAVALVVDRRALLVSSLAYVGYSLGALLPRSGFTLLEGGNLAVTLLVLGAVVLLLSLVWRPLRARLLSLLPAGLSNRLPPPAKSAVKA